jgi:hypothetical protein
LPLEHLGERPRAADVGKRDQQRAFRLHAAKEAHHLGRVARGGNGAPCEGDNFIEMARGLALEQAGEPRGLDADQLPEIRRALRQGGNQRAQRGTRGHERSERLARRRPRNLAEPIAHARMRRIRGGEQRRRGNTLRERGIC